MKICCLFFGVLLLTTSCKGRSDSEPQAIFTQIKEEITASTGREIYWNNDDNIVHEASLEELLKSELTIDRAVQIALLNNPSLQAEYERIGIASAQYRQAGMLQNPFFAFNYQFATASTAGDQMNLSLIQNFLEIFLIPLKKQVAAQEIVILKNEILGKILDVVARTKIAFHTLQIDRSILELREQIASLEGLAYEAAVHLRLAGNTTELDLAHKKMSYERANLAVTTALNTVINTKEDLNDLLGVWGSNVNWSYSKELEEFSDPRSATINIERDSIQNNLDLKNQLERIKQRATELSIQTTNIIFPDISFGYSSNYQQNVWFIGPQISINIPMFDLGKVHSIKAKAELTYMWKQFTAQAVTLRSIVRRATENFHNALDEHVHVIDELLPIAKKIFDESLLQYNAMNLGVFDLLKAKKAVFEREIVLLEKKSQFYNNKVFVQALGRGFVLPESFR